MRFTLPREDAGADAIAKWSLLLEVDCPHCGKEFDIVKQHDDLLSYVEPLQDSFVIDVECPACLCAFTAELTN